MLPVSLYAYWKKRHKSAQDACHCPRKCRTLLCREPGGNDILKVGHRRSLASPPLQGFLWSQETGGYAAESWMHVHLATFLHPFGYGTRLPEQFLCPPVITEEEIIRYLDYFYQEMPRKILYADHVRPMIPGNHMAQH